MRIVLAIVVLCLLAVTRLAWADAVGCGCSDDTTVSPPYGNDLAVPRDQAAPVDLAAPGDLSLPRDACRERTRRHRAAGAGSLAVAALALSGVVVARRRVRA